MSSLVNAALNWEGSAEAFPAQVAAVEPPPATSAELERLYQRIDQLERELGTDELTGIANRRALYAYAQQLTGSAVVVVADLDQFKPINDQYGHHIGDLVLSAIAHRLHTALAPYGLVTRLGGDEFAAIIDRDTPLENITDTASRVLAAVLRQFDTPLKTAGQTFTVGISIGAAHSGQNESFTTGLHRADIAMYRAKTTGAGVAFYDPDLDGLVNEVAPKPHTRVRDLPALAPRLRHMG